jgi:uncharacterized protein (TIGR03083 family)
VDIRDAARDEMLDLAGLLAELDDEQWNSPSLCGLWRIRDMLAHVTAGAEGAFGIGAIAGGMIRHRFNSNRWVAVDGQRRGQHDPAVILNILNALRTAAANGKALSGARPVTSLMHILIHGQDMCRPLGIERQLPEAHLVSVADFVKNDVFLFRAKKRIAGLKLTATDMDWSHGIGPEVTGPAEALIMMMAGRSVALDELAGEGKAALITRR